MNSTTTSRPGVFVASTTYSRVNVNYIIPAICSFGIVTNLICVVIFLLPRFNLKIYRLLFWKSLFHLAGLLIQVFTPVINDPNIGHSYATTAYRWVIRTWIYNAFCMAALLCNLAVSFDRLIMISKWNCVCSKIPEIILVAAFFVFSLACFFFPFFAYYIFEVADNYYELYYTDWGRSVGFVQLRVAMFGLRDIVLWFLFVVVNIVLLYQARKLFRRKAEMTATGAVNKVYSVATEISRVDDKTTTAGTSSITPKTKTMSAKAERRMTYMTVVMSAVLAFGQMPYFITISCSAAFFSPSIPYRNAIAVILNQLAFDTLYFSFAVSVFIYYFFDKNFESVIHEFCKRVKSLFIRN